MASQLAAINELMEIYTTYRPPAEVAYKRNAILRSLDVEQFAALQKELLARNKCGDEAQLAIVEDVMADLLSCTEFPLDSLLKAQLDAGWTPLDYLYRGAGEQTEKELLARLGANPKLALSGLAWIDKPHITAKFAEWKISPPADLDQSLIELFSHQAGWEPNSENEKRWLFSQRCYGITANNEKKAQTVISETSSNVNKTKPTLPPACLWCERPLFHLKNLESVYLQNLFSIKFTVDDIDIPFCLYCTNFGAVPMQLQTNGAAVFSQRIDINRRIDEPSYSLKTAGGILEPVVDSTARNPYSAVDSGRSYNLSQIGGFPTWTQDAHYPKCAECQETMMFLMQVESMDFPILKYEGIYHIFVCQYCAGEFAVQQTL